jgi:hypothetical protein
MAGNNTDNTRVGGTGMVVGTGTGTGTSVVEGDEEVERNIEKAFELGLENIFGLLTTFSYKQAERNRRAFRQEVHRCRRVPEKPDLVKLVKLLDRYV